MAVDDFTTVISPNIAGGGTVDRQPGSGIEEQFLEADTLGQEGSAAPGYMDGTRGQQIDGTNNEAIMWDSDGGTNSVNFHRGKYIITNAIYIRLTNRGGGTSDLAHGMVVVG
jgi:hypothetical protein